MRPKRLKTCQTEPYIPIRIIPLPVSSSIPTAQTKDVSFTTVMNWETRGGIMFRNAWGRMM